jgi:DNA-binding SARP family transcriptional activator
VDPDEFKLSIYEQVQQAASSLGIEPPQQVQQQLQALQQKRNEREQQEQQEQEQQTLHDEGNSQQHEESIQQTDALASNGAHEPAGVIEQEQS